MVSERLAHALRSRLPRVCSPTRRLLAAMAMPCPHCGHIVWLQMYLVGPDESPEAAGGSSSPGPHGGGMVVAPHGAGGENMIPPSGSKSGPDAVAAGTEAGSCGELRQTSGADGVLVIRCGGVEANDALLAIAIACGQRRLRE